MTDLVLSGLVKRRALIAGEIDAAQSRVRQLHADLAALDIVIRQFDPSYPVDAIAAKRPRGPASLPGGPDIGRTVLGILRDAGGPMTVAAITERVLLLRGLDTADGAVRKAVEGSASRALRHQREKGAVRNPAKAGRAVLWELAG